jgi:nucleolar protein 53
MLSNPSSLQKRALAERAAKKRMMAVIPSAKMLRRTNARLTSMREKELAKKQLGLQDNMKQHGLAGQKLGKHKVPEGRVDVQLGEELSESLRALKVCSLLLISGMVR